MFKIGSGFRKKNGCGKMLVLMKRRSDVMIDAERARRKVVPKPMPRLLPGPQRTAVSNVEHVLSDDN